MDEVTQEMVALHEAIETYVKTELRKMFTVFLNQENSKDVTIRRLTSVYVPTEVPEDAWL